MLKTFAVVLLALAMSVGFAQAKMHKIPACAEGRQATATCACGPAVGGHWLLCKKGQWCHAFMHACGM